jgi:hypothetical protein
MDITRSELTAALRTVGLLGTVESGMFDNVLLPPGGTDYSSQIQELQAKDASQDSTIVQIDQRVVTLENKDTVDYSTQISELKATDTAQDGRITAAEASLLTKAGLVNGKVPYEQLPQFPVGRKVNVANQASRFALPVYADLTIAYQSDTGDAWGLDANADPAISNNWSKLGNAQGIGVASFNGRTGNIGPMSGDYNTGQITEILDKRFVTSDQITQWTTAASATKITSFNGRSGAVSPALGDYTADLVTEGTNRKWLTPTQISTWDAKETTTGSQTKATAAQAAAKTYADSTFIPLNQKNAANGVAPLDSSSRVPVANLPTFLPRRQRTWHDLLATNVKDVWYATPSDVETDIYIATSAENSGAYVLIEARQNSSGTIFSFFGTTVSSTTNGPTVSTVCNVTVPQGWEYRLKGSSLGTRTLTRWYELR